MKQDYLFNMNCVSGNVDWMKVLVIRSKNEILMNVSVSVMNYWYVMKVM